MTRVKLTDAQWRALDAICRTNGGGIYAGGRDMRSIFALHKKGLVEGKLNQQFRAVHTREGLEYWRSRNAEAAE